MNLPALEELNFDSCPVGDWAMAHLADNNVVPNLTSLDLADTDLVRFLYLAFYRLRLFFLTI
jgi:hypothetical protein